MEKGEKIILKKFYINPKMKFVQLRSEDSEV